jgi:hypothetical protein
MSKQLFDDAQEVIGARATWEQKQRLYYQMRHDGLRRRNKPWPGAADMHFPEVDMVIAKSKPFWEAQATSTERLASFVALQQQQEAETSAAAEFFDYELKQNTNFLTELSRAIDTMLLRGRGVIKAVVDPFDDYRIIFEGIDPMFILMADGADDFDDADWFVHIRHLTVAQYKRDRRYNQEAGVIEQIRGQKDYDVANGILQDKEAREGVNFSRKPNQVLIWEHWVKTMGGWTVHSYSPQQPDVKLRQPFGCPYKVGGKASCPFFSFKRELKEKGWYAPRGLAELVQHFEQYLCKLWNEKTDAMTYGNRPVFTSANAIQNSANVRWNPGEFIPGDIKAVQGAQPAFSFDQEQAFTRSVAEQLAMLPDFGISQPGMPAGQDKPRTATENNRIATLQSVGTESQGRLFRMDLGRLYRHVWGLMLQFRRKEIIYYTGQELKTLPVQALHDAYLIMPDGAPDQWNKQLRQQRADIRFQKYLNHPNVDQEELVYQDLAADDPLVAQKLFIPGNTKAASEAEDEAVELMILQEGFPAAVKPNEDHATRIHVLIGWLKKQAMLGVPVNPVAQQRVQQHLAVHWQMLRKVQPAAARQLQAQIQQEEQAAMMGQQGARLGEGPGPLGPGGGPLANGTMQARVQV